jgi:general secretion pathway protein D
MSVQPSIDPETGEIILFVRPSISRLNKSVADPAVDIAYNANLSVSGNNVAVTPSMVPVVEVREIDSVLRLQNGEIGIMGGLMEVRSYDDKAKIPGLGDLQFVKEIFSSAADGDSVVELVIIIKATITDGAPLPDAADNRLTEKYIADPRKWSS